MIRLLPLLLLAGCAAAPEIEAQAEQDNARLAELELRVAELEAAVKQSEQRNRSHITRLFENDEAIRQNFNHLGRFHNIPPLEKAD